MTLPVQWVWLSVVPIIVWLLVSGYIKKLKAAGIEIESDVSKQVPDLGWLSRNGGKSPSVPAMGARTKNASDTWTETHEAEHNRARELFLVHTCDPSRREGQKYDVTIFLMQHIWGEEPNKIECFEDIKQAEFYFGKSWGDQIFTVVNNGGPIGVRISAWGQFLATCRITFKQGHEQPTLQRYIDFEMADKMVALMRGLPDKEEIALLSWLRQRPGH